MNRDDGFLRQSYARYLISFGLVFFVLGALIAITNILVDPGAVYNVVTVDGVNSTKSKLSKYNLLWKMSHLESNRPAVVFLGNSRTEVGINPDSVLARQLFTPNEEYFNSAIASSSIYGVMRYFQHAVAVGAGSRAVIIGIDYVMFRNSNQTVSHAGYLPYEPFFATSNKGEPQVFRQLELLSRLVLSTDAFYSSWQTVRHQSAGDVDFNPHGNLLNNKIDEKVSEHRSPRSYFLKEEQSWIDAYIHFSGKDYDIDDGMRDFQTILDVARDHNIRVLFYITPTHVALQYLEGEVDAPENHLALWKTGIMAMIAESNQRTPTQPPVELWDFSVVNDVLAEPLPSEVSKQKMHWYLDPGHYREALGDKVMQVLLTGKPVQTQGGEVFGYRVMPENVDAINRLHHESILRWQEHQPVEYSAFMERIAERRAAPFTTH